MKKIILSISLSFLYSTIVTAQKSELKTALFDGVVVSGYVDDGAFLNFTGPNIKFQCDNSTYMVGMLPSLRFKEDEGMTKNSFVSPALGLGVTYTYKFFAIQLPLYYNGKTSVENGEWNIGIGVGLKLNQVFNGKN